MPRTRRRLLPSLIAALLLATAAATPAAAWNNGNDDGDGYGTHDWVIDAALKVLDGEVNGWFDASVARLASDDPDNVGATGENDNVYRDVGVRGGAVHRVAEHYAAAERHYRAGRYTDASREIGLMSHYLSDIMMPWHSHYDGIGAAGHLEYEQLVGREQESASESPGWMSTRRTVSTISNARSTAINAAAYSRSHFPELYAEFTKDMTTLNSRVREITKLLMVRTANDLADMIWSISQGKGVPPTVAKLATSVKWPYAKQNEPWQGVFVTATDAAGKPIEGLRVVMKLPIPYGSTTTYITWTDGNGFAKWAGGVGTSPYMTKRTVATSATTDGTTVTGSTWFVTSPPLAEGSTGFSSWVNDSSPVTGETVVVSSRVRDTSGHPVAGLRVTWTWDYGHTTKTTTALTNSSGVASSSRLITEQGITTGCGDLIFCPDGSVTREQMASFLVRALDLPSTTKNYFTDDDGSKHHAAINALAASGITAGCGEKRFCPSGLVTRAQMASFLVRALNLPTTTTDYFGDDDGNKHESNVNRLASSGVTSGCGTNRFCPNGVVVHDGPLHHITYIWGSPPHQRAE